MLYDESDETWGDDEGDAPHSDYPEATLPSLDGIDRQIEAMQTLIREMARSALACEEHRAE